MAVNSNWTAAHISHLWGGAISAPEPPAAAAQSAEGRPAEGRPGEHPAASGGRPRRRVEVVFPPCDTSALQALPLARPAEGPGLPYIISIAQVGVKTRS